MGHGDELRRLAAKYLADNRYTNFGAAINSMEVQGFRGVQSLQLNFRSPVTAICGLNGTGKSTLAQLSTCAYRKPLTASKARYYVKDFFPVSPADPAPFTTNAKIVFNYAVERGADSQQVTVTRANKEWSGYKRQPDRACYYIGFTQFIPKVERRDFSIYGGHLIRLGSTRVLTEDVARKISVILGLPYEELGFTEVSHRKRFAELAMATRNGKQYSENHMGFGEGRVVYMVNAMETAPAQSLFVLEEPETSLHGYAQERLSRYLVDVAQRRGHQVILTTHSSAILGQLGADSIAYLHRLAEGSIEVTPGLATYQVDAYLRGDRAPGSRVICVEDAFARQFTSSVLRGTDLHLLTGFKFIEVGGHEQVRKAVGIIADADLKVVGLTDGDMSDNGKKGILSLPGGIPPEKLVYSDSAVCDYFAERYQISLAEVLNGVDDLHDYSRALAKRLAMDEPAVAVQACDAFVAARDAAEFSDLIKFIRDGLS